MTICNVKPTVMHNTPLITCRLTGCCVNFLAMGAYSTDGETLSLQVFNA